ncbi:MAG: hypothetical protein K2J80_07440, partial [Oscillospiraceae bacterium]|nr:hypothetical protein [Oscillospiraceae bacterium]
MYKKFSVNIGSGKDKADAPPDRKRKDPQKLLMLFAFVFAVVMAAGIIAILAIAKRMVGSDYIERNNA